jgi:hypothetical protein
VRHPRFTFIDGGDAPTRRAKKAGERGAALHACAATTPSHRESKCYVSRTRQNSSSIYRS